jgi:hypothetical protein
MKHQPSQSFPEQARGMTRRALAKQHTRQRLLAAARRLFVDRGYEAATIREPKRNCPPGLCSPAFPTRPTCSTR